MRIHAAGTSCFLDTEFQTRALETKYQMGRQRRKRLLQENNPGKRIKSHKNR